MGPQNGHQNPILIIKAAILNSETPNRKSTKPDTHIISLKLHLNNLNPQFHPKPRAFCPNIPETGTTKDPERNINHKESPNMIVIVQIMTGFRV